MRHRNSGRKLGRNSSHRNAMFRNMVTSLINEERIETTLPKAKELRPIIEKLLTSAKHNAPSVVAAAAEDQKVSKVATRVAAIRQAGKFVRGKDALQKLFGALSEQYQQRPGGYTRIVKTRNRLGDNAEMAIIELIPASAESAEG
jgi:large subunit ribosomal protein L17